MTSCGSDAYLGRHLNPIGLYGSAGQFIRAAVSVLTVLLTALQFLALG